MCTIIRQEIRKIRKPHRCWGCVQKFPPGTQMEYFLGIGDGEVSDSYWCLDCSKFVDAIYKHTKLYSECCEGLEFGEVRSLKANPHYYKIPEIVFTDVALPYPSMDKIEEDSVV